MENKRSAVMVDEVAEPSSTTNSSGTTADFEVIDAGLATIQANLARGARDAGRARELFHVVRPFWTQARSDEGGSVAYGREFIHALAGTIHQTAAETAGFTAFLGTISGSTAAVVANTTSIAWANYGVSDVSDNLDRIEQYVDRERIYNRVKSSLALLSTDLYERFEGVCHALDLPSADPTTGPLYQTRQLLIAFLETLAPDAMVAAEPGFSAEAPFAKHNPKGVSYRQRLSYIAKTRISEPRRLSLFVASQDVFIGHIRTLSSAHDLQRLSGRQTRVDIDAAIATLGSGLDCLDPL
jgi:hypothetical protein